MKQLAILSIIAFLLLSNAPFAFAALPAVGDTCDPNAQIPDCLGTEPALVCDPSTKKCVDPTKTAATADGTTATNDTAAQGTGGEQTTDFIPLLPSLPGIQTLQSANSLAPFLSQIYKICIGLAATLAILQLIRAGVLYMGGDSITEKKEARDLITLSIVGLLLVLTPVIVFTIINPKILDLNIDASSLKVSLDHITQDAGAGTGSLGQADPGAAALNKGDGSCNFDCPAGKTCTGGKCVDVTAPANCTPIPGGTAITSAQYGCCTKQPGYRIELGQSSNGPVEKCQYASTYNYLGYVLNTTQARRDANYTVIPSQQSQYITNRDNCKAANGTFTTTDDNTKILSANICPESSGLANSSNYWCVYRIATCR